MSSAPGRKTLVIGRDGPTLQFKSVSGDLLIVEPRDAAAPQTATTQASTSVSTTPGESGAASSSDAVPDETWAAEPPAEPTDLATARLDILRALERGDLSVDAATERLAELEAPVR
jgi:hypothetical protein